MICFWIPFGQWKIFFVDATVVEILRFCTPTIANFPCTLPGQLLLGSPQSLLEDLITWFHCPPYSSTLTFLATVVGESAGSCPHN